MEVTLKDFYPILQYHPFLFGGILGINDP